MWYDISMNKKLKPPFVIRPGLHKKVYTFPKDYCTLNQYDKLLVKLEKKAKKELELLEIESEMLYAKAFE